MLRIAKLLTRAPWKDDVPPTEAQPKAKDATEEATYVDNSVAWASREQGGGMVVDATDQGNTGRGSQAGDAKAFGNWKVSWCTVIISDYY